MTNNAVSIYRAGASKPTEIFDIKFDGSISFTHDAASFSLCQDPILRISFDRDCAEAIIEKFKESISAMDNFFDRPLFNATENKWIISLRDGGARDATLEEIENWRCGR